MGRDTGTAERVPAAPSPSAPSDGTASVRGRWRTIAVALVALAAGIGGTVWATGSGAPGPQVSTRGADAPDRTATVDLDALGDAEFVELPAPPTDIPDAPATEAVAAVEGFLTAEAATDFTRSFDFLSTGSQGSFGGTPGTWVAAHADVMPPVTGFSLGEPAAAGDGATQVTSTVGFRPSLDEIVGLVPLQARVTWLVVEQADGTFGVDLEASAFEPIHIDDTTASQAVGDWLAARQACERTGEWGGTLLGVEGPVRDLCGETGQLTVGPPAPLDAFEATPFTAAFGEDVLTWAREVAVDGPVELRAVVAPIGTEWRVIGALPPAPGR